MKNTGRREFLRQSAGRRAGCRQCHESPSPVIRRARAAEAKVKTGTIQDVRHIVILMQENRSSEHYFGILHGVRDRVCFSLPEEAFWNSLFSATPVCAWSITASA
jgi:phospholipase C